MLFDEKPDLGEVRILRDAAARLRSEVSQGAYGDEELERFWKLAGIAGAILSISDAELGARAGLSNQFISSVARDRRRPKLTNFLKTLTAIIEVAETQLAELDGANPISGGRSSPEKNVIISRIRRDYSELRLLATSLAELARAEIAKLDNNRPNDPATIEGNKRQRELLLIFTNGFEQISSALAELSHKPDEASLLDKAKNTVRNASQQINKWWSENKGEAIDWSVRLPVFAAGVAMLGWAGANMTVATSAVAAIVGGTKVAAVIKGERN